VRSRSPLLFAGAVGVVVVVVVAAAVGVAAGAAAAGVAAVAAGLGDGAVGANFGDLGAVIRITLLAETAFLASKCLMVAIFHLDPGWRSTA